MELRSANFTLEEERVALRDTFKMFLERECSSELVRAAEPLGFDEQLWSQLGKMGMVAMAVPTASGGDGAGLIEMVLVAEEMGRRAAPVPFAETVAAARLLAACGSAAASWCDAAVEGTKLITIALRPLRLGVPQLIAGGAVADAVVGLLDGEVVVVSGPLPLPHVTNHGQAPLGRLDIGAPGVTISPLASGASAVASFTTAVREWELLIAAAELGMAVTAREIATEFVTNRVAFGVPIATFQAMSHPIVDSYIGIIGGRRLVWQAAWFADHEPDAKRELIPMAFTYACRVAMAAATTGVHVQGGLGFTVESDMQFYFRRAKGWANVAGDPQDGLLAIADELYGPATSD